MEFGINRATPIEVVLGIRFNRATPIEVVLSPSPSPSPVRCGTSAGRIRLPSQGREAAYLPSASPCPVLCDIIRYNITE